MQLNCFLLCADTPFCFRIWIAYPWVKGWRKIGLHVLTVTLFASSSRNSRHNKHCMDCLCWQTILELLSANTSYGQILSLRETTRNYVYCVDVCLIFGIQNQKAVDNGCNSYFHSISLLILWNYTLSFVCYNFMVMSIFHLAIDFFFHAPLFSVSEGIYLFSWLWRI
jgi:hypothetical protein